MSSRTILCRKHLTWYHESSGIGAEIQKELHQRKYGYEEYDGRMLYLLIGYAKYDEQNCQNKKAH